MAGGAEHPRPRWVPGRRHGPGQDPPGHRPPPPRGRDQGPARPDARRLPHHAARQLGAGDRALRAGPRRPSLPRQRPPARCSRAPRGGAHHLRHRSARCRGPGRGGVGAGDGRRGPARQEPTGSHGQGVAGHPGPEPHRPHRHAGREPPQRAVVDHRLVGARPARPARGVPPRRGRAHRAGSGSSGDRAVRAPRAPLPAPPPQERPRHRARPAAEDRDRSGRAPHRRADHPLRGDRAGDPGPHPRRRGHPTPGPGVPAAHGPEAGVRSPRARTSASAVPTPGAPGSWKPSTSWST